jgi:hypothetical protein
VSTTDGDASSRFDGAIADVLSETPRLPGDTEPNSATPAAPPDDWSVDDDPPSSVSVEGPDAAEPYTLPQIVPATAVPLEARTPTPTPTPPAPGLPTATPPVVPVATPPTPAPAPTAAQPAPATGWSDHTVGVPAGGSMLRAPGRRPRVRRVTRVLRHVDPWSTFKVALLFSFVAYLVTLTAGVLLWRVADSTGTLDNVERWFTQFGWETFELKGGEIFRNAWILGLFGAVALTGALVLLATLFNLVSDIVGGVRMTVLEEEVVERTVSSTRRYVVRRPPTGGGAADWGVDDDTLPASSESSGAAAPLADTATPPADDWSVDDDGPDPG